MSDKGWIKLYRQLQECPMWYSERFSKGQAWVDLLLLANHKDKKILFNGEMIVIKRGQYLTSMVKLAEKWKWNRKTVSSYLNVLEKDKMITKLSDNSKTLITIENYEIYQCTDEEYGQPIGQPIGQGYGQPIGQQMDNPLDTNKNDKNDNNILCSNSLNETEIEEQKKNEIDKQQQRKELESNFEIIYKSYPKKKGKARGFDLYKGWLKGRDISGRKVKLTNRQIWSAIAMYKKEIEKNGTELQFVQQFDTFMNKTILDYVGDDTE